MLKILIFFFIAILQINSSCIFNIQAKSAGLNDGNYFTVTVNNVQKSGLSTCRGMNFAQYDAITGEFLDSRCYDTHASQDHSNNMASYIGGIPPGIIVIAGVIDEAQQSMNSNGYNALYSIGMQQGLTLGYRDSYILIGGKDLKATGAVVQQHKARYSGNASVSKCILNSIPNNCSNYINLASGGMQDYERFQYYVNYQKKSLPSSVIYERGLFIVVFDKDDASIIKDVKRYDTYLDSSENNNFVNYMNGIASGDHVLIGAMDSVEAFLTPSSYDQIKSIGGPSSLAIGHRESFAIIGTKGAAVGSATWKKNTIGGGGVLIGKCIQGCSYQCGTCSGHKNNCDSCSRATGVNSAPNCNCAIKFYEQSQSQCSSCLNKCAECNNNTGCTVCTGVGRSSTIPNCSCLQGYYETGANQTDCGKCQYPCGNCTGSATNCTDCSTAPNRKDTTTCQCSDNYYDNNSECVTCTYPCQKCSSTSICLTCQTTANRVSTTNCNCVDNYYETGSECSQCIYPCQNCSGNGNQCTSCVLDDNRSNSHPCGCNSGYFDNGNECQKCHYKCSECSSYDTCTSCSDLTRDENINCECLQGKFDTGVEECSDCSYKCLSCSGSATNCDVCAIGDGRTDATKPDCNCKLGYFDDGSNSATCIACVHPCINCTSLTTCQSCVVRDNNDIAPSCKCLDTFYEKIDLTCQACTHPCLHCVDSDTKCTQCVSTVNRQATPSCLCTPGFYDNGSDLECQPCTHPCSKCTGEGLNQCTECIIRANINDSPNCHCKDGFYEDSNQVCQKCPNRYETCTSPTNGTCAVGIGRNMNPPNCGCSDTYFDDGTDSLDCIECIHPCINCQSLTVCDSCVIRDFANDISTCTCQNGYYEKQDLKCEICSKQCSTCVNTNDNCLECIPGSNRNAKPDCKCKDGFYQDENLVCQPCVYPCLKCTAENVCLDCQNTQNRNLPPLDNSTCDCKDGFYDDGSKCEECLMQCQTCINSPGECVQCSEQTRHGGQCICKDGLYDVGVPKCESCNYKCGTCINEDSNCLSCSQDSRDINNNCECKDGFYEDQQEKLCKPCQYPCVNCQTQYICISCVQFQNEIENSRKPVPSCYCAKGFYENMETRMCQQCHSRCSQCENTSENCTQCSDEETRQGVDQGCLCKTERFYVQVQNNVETCQPCPDNCKKCNNQGICIQCDINKALPPLCQQVIEEDRGYATFSVIVNGQDTVVSKICSIQCSSCENDINTCTSCRSGYKRSMILPECGCQDGYYSDDQVKDCQKCEKHCIRCTSYNKCLQCDESLNRQISKQTGYCECINGYKEYKGQCQKCYQYKKQCVQVCPVNTVQDEELKSCIDITIQYKSNLQIILICTVLILFVMFSAKIIFVKVLGKQMKGFNQDNFKNINNISDNNISPNKIDLQSCAEDKSDIEIKIDNNFE